MADYLYLSFSSEEENKYLSIGDLYFKKLELNEKMKKEINNQLDDWEIRIYKQWYHEDLSYNHIDKGESTEFIPVKDIVNMNGPCCSNEIAGAYLVEDSQFSGVIIQFSTYSSFGMSCNTSTNYCILKTNGEIIGKNSNRSGHCSTEVDEWNLTIYSLNHKEQKAE